MNPITWSNMTPEQRADYSAREAARKRAKTAAKNAVPRPCACGCGLMFIGTYRHKYAPDCKRNETPERKREINRLHDAARRRRRANQPPKPKPPKLPRLEKPAKADKPKAGTTRPNWTHNADWKPSPKRRTKSAVGEGADKLLPGVARVIRKVYETSTDPYERARLRANNPDLFG